MAAKSIQKDCGLLLIKTFTYTGFLQNFTNSKKDFAY